MDNSEAIIQFVDQLIAHAEQQAASDIHLEPKGSHYRVRYRQEGILHEVAELPEPFATRIITRLKVMAQLDIAERRLPQDGRLQIKAASHTPIDTRISLCPMLGGEKLVLRLLDNSKQALTIDTLGFSLQQKTLFLEKIFQPQGLILVTGPTGSGKTLTLYAALQQLNHQEKNIVTVEDPIEIPIDGLNQVQLNPKIGLDFAAALRAFLRQDPDIIMLGEIRDKETAEIAIQAAHTGHLVLATVHANNALEAIPRLRLIGCKPHDVVQAVSLIVAQRLVRKRCDECPAEDNAPSCLQTQHGRTAIFECLAMSEALALLILKNANRYQLLKAAQQEGFISLQEAGMEKVTRGEITLTELRKILPYENISL